MILAFNLGDIVTVPFGYLLSFLYDITTNYGVALILFAILVRFILLPATAKGKKSTMKMSRLTPRIQAIQKKYENDQQKQSQAIQALYKEEGVSMGGGCLWSFLPILILFPLYSVVRQPIMFILHETLDVTGQIMNVVKAALPDLIPANSVYYEQMIVSPMLPELAEQLPALKEIAIANADTLTKGVDFTFLGINLGTIPQWKVWEAGWAWDWNHIGGALIPILSSLSQVGSMLISQRMNNSLVTDEKGLEDKEAAKNSQANQTSKAMMWMMPLMSLFFGFVQCQTHILFAVNGQEILSNAGNPSIEQSLCCWVDTEDSSSIIQQNQSFFHISGDLVKFFLLMLQYLHLTFNFYMLCMNTVKQWRKFFINIVFHRLFQL